MLGLELYEPFFPSVVRRMGLDWRSVERTILIFLSFDTYFKDPWEGHIVSVARRAGLRGLSDYPTSGPDDREKRFSLIYSFASNLSEDEFIDLIFMAWRREWDEVRGFHGYFYPGGCGEPGGFCAWAEVEASVKDALNAGGEGAACMLREVCAGEGETITSIVEPLSSGFSRKLVRERCVITSNAYRALLKTGIYKLCGTRSRPEYCVPFEAIPAVMRTLAQAGYSV